MNMFRKLSLLIFLYSFCAVKGDFFDKFIDSSLVPALRSQPIPKITTDELPINNLLEKVSDKLEEIFLKPKLVDKEVKDVVIPIDDPFAKDGSPKELSVATFFKDIMETLQNAIIDAEGNVTLKLKKQFLYNLSYILYYPKLLSQFIMRIPSMLMRYIRGAFINLYLGKDKIQNPHSENNKNYLQKRRR